MHSENGEHAVNGEMNMRGRRRTVSRTREAVSRAASTPRLGDEGLEAPGRSVRPLWRVLRGTPRAVWARARAVGRACRAVGRACAAYAGRRRTDSMAADAGMVTSEYAMGIVAAVGFASLLYKVARSAWAQSALQDIMAKALDVH